MTATAEAIRAMEQAHLRQLEREHPDLVWELVDDPSDPLAPPDDVDPVLDRSPLAA